MVWEGSDSRRRAPSTRRRRLGRAVLLVGLALVGPAWALPPTGDPAGGFRVLGQPERGPVPVTPARTGVSPPTFQARADAWFKAPKTDPDARRTEMRAVTSALKQPCRHCHTPAFDGYTDRLEISRQMMALSAEHGVACADCHAGKDDYTDLGRQAIRMWQLSHEQGRFCESCHEAGQQFKRLTAEGQRFRAGPWPAWDRTHPLPAPKAAGATPAPPASAPALTPTRAPGSAP